MLQGMKKLKLTKILETKGKNANLAAENSIGFQIHIECHVTISLVNLSNYVDVT